MNQRDLVGATAFNMAVGRIVAGVDDTAGEPAAIDTFGRIEDLLRWLDPVDLLRRLGPKARGISQRARMDLVITTRSVDVSLDVHRSAPVPFIRLVLT